MEGLGRALTDAGIAHHVLGVPAMFGIAIREEQPTDYRTWADSATALYEELMMAMVRKGALPEPDGREPWFLCAALSERDVEETLNCFEDAVKAVVGK
jgi:glutamate-1-semialdehyde 2,1-aminomutase